MRVQNDTETVKLKDHLNELRTRLTWASLSVVIFSALAYGLNQHITSILQSPLNQTLYYTSPGGGFSFILKLSILSGIMISLPLIIYHIFGFLAPLIKKRRKWFVATYTAWSFILAYGGALFAYYINLPAALHFLVQFGGDNIQSLIGVNEYFNFVLSYLLGFCLLFQIPLVILFLDNITPQNPKNMMKYQRYIIAGSFIVAALLTPTPDPVNQTFMALPIIALYQVGVILVWRKRYLEQKAGLTSNKQHHDKINRQNILYEQLTKSAITKKAKNDSSSSAPPIKKVDRIRKYPKSIEGINTSTRSQIISKNQSQQIQSTTLKSHKPKIKQLRAQTHRAVYMDFIPQAT